MSIKLTYKGSQTEYDSDHIKLNILKQNHGAYLEDDVEIEAEGGVVDLDTDTKMDNFLIDDNAGKYVRYTGTTTTKYHSGSIYKVVSNEGAIYENQGTYGFEIDNTILNLDHDVYDNFYKSNNWNKHSTNSVVKVSWVGTKPIAVWINSYAESNYDYTIASTLNASSVPTAYTSANVQMHTRGFQKNPRNGLTETNFKKYTYTGGAGTNFIYIVYRKDGSSHAADDRGYFVITKTEALLYEEFPLLDTDTTNITGTSKVDVTHSKNAQVVDANLVEGNIKEGIRILGKLGTYRMTPNLQNKYITANGSYAADAGYDGLGIVDVNVTSPGPGPTPGSGYSVTLMRNGYENDSDIWFKINGVSKRIDVQEDGYSFYKYPPMAGIETIAVSADHFSTPFSVASSWFRIKPINSSVWHNLSKDEVYTLLGDSVLQFGFGSCLLKGTLIKMADGTYLPIECVQEDMYVMGYDGEPKRVYKSQYREHNYNDSYAIWKIATKDGVKEIRTTYKHEFYNVEQGRMCYLVYENEDVPNQFIIGDHLLDEDDNKCELLSCTVVEEPCEHYSLWCEDNVYYANGFVCGNRHSVMEVR